MDIIGVDPGTHQSGVVRITTKPVIVLMAKCLDNNELLEWLQLKHDALLAIETFRNQGRAIVGQEVFDTCIWIGRFQQAWQHPEEVRLVPRQLVKLTLCGTPRAKDANIRQALIDLLGAPGTKKNPGPTYGVTSHAWSALAVAVTAMEVVHDAN